MAALPNFTRRDTLLSAKDSIAGKFQPAAFRKGVISLHERFQKQKKRLWGGAVLCLSLALCLSGFTGTAQAATVKDTAATSTARTLIPVGHTIGIKLFSKGVLVVKLSEGSSPARSCGLETGDAILKCNGKSVTSTEQFQGMLHSSQGQEVKLQVRRGAAVQTLTVTPKTNDDGVYCIGAWIRDSMAGIGTMTFYDPDTGVFGALGHGITDTDTAVLMPFSSGTILPSTVKAVKRGEVGSAGELKGSFDLTTDTGSLYANTGCGIFGSLADEKLLSRMGDPIPVAENSEVHTGPATILANVDGDEVREYGVQISKILSTDSDSRNLMLTVTDPHLLEKTGGIVQGMSGSPILQDGKIVGAVTHVLLNNPTSGYGILIRNMLSNADSGCVENAS